MIWPFSLLCRKAKILHLVCDKCGAEITYAGYNPPWFHKVAKVRVINGTQYITEKESICGSWQAYDHKLLTADDET